MDFIDLITSESTIWKQVYECNTLLAPGWIAFREPKYPTHPHWNILYPQSVQTPRLTYEMIHRIKDWYEERGISPHVLDLSNDSEASAVSYEEYFSIDKQTGMVASYKDLSIQVTEDLSVFSSTLQQAFSLPSDFVRYFVQKMDQLRAVVPSTFFLAKHETEICGCWSVFRAKPDADFMMNFGLRPQFKGMRLSQQLMNAVVAHGIDRIYTHTNNPILATSLLPKAGFTSAGKAIIVRLNDYKIQAP